MKYLLLLLLCLPAQADLQIGQKIRVQNVSANYTATNSDDMINVDASGGARTITLSSAALASNKGKVVTIKKTDSSVNTVTISTVGGQTIDTLSNQFLVFQNSLVTLVSNGTNWLVQSSSARTRMFGVNKITGCAGSFQRAAAGSTLTSYTAQTGCIYTVEGYAQAPTTMLPATKFAFMPAGDYRMDYEGTIGANGTSGTIQTNQFTDGTNTTREISTIVENAVATGSYPGISQTFTYTTSQLNVTWQLFSAVSDANNTQVFGTTAKPGVIRVWYSPAAGYQ